MSLKEEQLLKINRHLKHGFYIKHVNPCTHWHNLEKTTENEVLLEVGYIATRT
jgi:hypothetical protein